MIPHFHKAALLMLSDRMVIALNLLDIRDADSIKQFKRTIRQLLEIFLRFTHRYWFHEISNQAIARSVYGRLTRFLGNEDLYGEVRDEVTDMNNYLDSDSARRQANTVLRLTVVTIVGLIGTIASGLLGMNIIDEAARPAPIKLLIFLVFLGFTLMLTIVTLVQSKRLADVLDALSDARLGWREKWRAMRVAWKSGP
jgi:Mg2+ and Co2+ transporter CorA